MKKLLIIDIKVRRAAENWESYESRAYRLPFDSTGPNANKMDTNDLMEYAHTLDVLSKTSVPREVQRLTEADYGHWQQIFANQDDLDTLGLTGMQIEIRSDFRRVKP